MSSCACERCSSTLPKRDAALHTLGQVCSSTGYIVSPLIDCPQLLQLLSRVLRTETKQTVRREIIKVLRILGALDPYRRKVRAHVTISLGFALIARGRPSQTMKPLPPSWRPPISLVLRRETLLVSAWGQTTITSTAGRIRTDEEEERRRQSGERGASES